ncbi:MAG TPA: Wzz/FepE/Etk N-terminal domain-containing protein [Mucilaginibacter sp.]|jgi:hypothetical protein
MAENSYENKNNSTEVTLRDLIIKTRDNWKYLKNKWKKLLLAVVLGIVLGLAYSFLKKPVYDAKLSFAIEDDNSSGGLGAAMGLASQFGLDLGGGSSSGAFSGDNLMELLKSRSMIENTLLTSINVDGKLQTLAERYIAFNNIRESWADDRLLRDVKFPPNPNRDNFSLQQDSVLGVFYRTIVKANLKVDKADKKLSIITVDVNSKDELFSKYFAENLIKNVSDFYIETKTRKSSQSVNLLQRQTDSVRNRLNEAISGVASTSDVNPNPNPSLQIIRVPSLKRQVDVQANTAILTELVKNLEISKMSLRRETPLIQVIDRPILPLEKNKVGKLKGGVLGALVGFVLGAVVILIRKKLRNILS